METVKNFIENTIDNSQRFENSKEELIYYQFKYLEKLHSGTLKPLDHSDKIENLSFREKICEKTWFKYYMSEQYSLRKEKDIESSKTDTEEFNRWFDLILDELESYYKSDDKNWIDNLGKIFRNSLEKIGPAIRKQNDIDNSAERAGLIKFFLTNRAEGIGKYGFNEDDQFISIHLESFISQKNRDDSVKNIFSGESLSKLAEDIVDKYPQARAVIASSWLVGSPIGKRIGFTIYREQREVSGDDAFWGQFLDDKGEIKKDKIKIFLETGIPEFFRSDGFIEVEDFLKKYLPREKRGFVVLKNLTKESLDFGESVNKTFIEINKRWKEISSEEIITLLKNNKVLEPYWDTVDGQEYLKMIKAKRDLGVTGSDGFFYENEDDIKNKFRDFIQEHRNKYSERKVFIE